MSGHGIKLVPELWLGRLLRGERGVLPTLSNAIAILANDQLLDGLFAYNAFACQHLLMRAPPVPEDGAAKIPGPYPRPWATEDVALIQSYLQRLWCPRFSRAAVEDAMVVTASMKQFHPITDWLATLKWDRKPRLDFWLSNAFDVENNAFHRSIAAKFMIAAVRRVRHPGVKFDTMLILEGVQDLGKSSAAKALFGETWFSDAIPPDLSSKDAAMSLLGVWCLEFAEIEHLIRSEPETIKAFVSRQVDRYRPPYAKAFVERPRQGVLLGTTNDDDYLRDTTGNRRTWPVRCRTADVAWVALNREDLWAEAAAREAAGERIWLQNEETTAIARAAQSERLAEDAWESTVLLWTIGRTEVRIPDILNSALALPKDKQTRREVLRVAAILRANGWNRWIGRLPGRIGVHRAWIAPGHDPPASPETTRQDEMFN
jgi:predicted P-loop ATPase